MKAVLKKTLESRKLLHGILTNTSDKDLTKIPRGFNNNIFWNIAHVVVTQELLLYKLSGLPMQANEALINKYRKGTFPEDKPIDKEEKELVEKLLFSTLEKALADYEGGIFTDFMEYPTSVGIILSTIDDAIAFNTYHEGLHLGSILALRRAIVLV